MANLTDEQQREADAKSKAAADAAKAEADAKNKAAAEAKAAEAEERKSLVKMTHKEQGELHVHSTTVAAHRAAGWTVAK